MNKIIITVKEINEQGESKSLVLEQNYEGLAEEMAELFRTIMYWQTFQPGTINYVITDGETISDDRDDKIDDLLNKDVEALCNETTH